MRNTPRNTPRNTRQQGFTLVELITVIAIIGVLSTVAGSALYYAIPRMRLRSAGQDVYRAMQLAKTEAVKRNRAMVLEFPRLTKCADLYRENPMGFKYRIYQQDEKSDWRFEDTLPARTAPCAESAGFSVSGAGGAGKAQVVFDPKGLPVKNTKEKKRYIALGNNVKGMLYVQLEPAGSVRIRNDKP